MWKTTYQSGGSLMYFKCNKKDLVDAVNVVQKAVAAKSTNPLYEGIFLEAKGSTITLRGTETDVSIETVFLTEVIEEGKIVVDSKMFGDIIRKLPNNVITLEKQDNNSIRISAEKSVLNLLYMDATNFPEFPRVVDSNKLTFPQSGLKKMVKNVLFSVAQEDTRPILMGVLFEIKEGKINLVAMDGYRLAMVSEDIEEDRQYAKVVSGRTLRDVLSLLDDTEKDITISFTDNHALFEVDSVKIISRLLQGEYLRYENMIPDYSKLSVVIERSEFLEAVDRANVMANEGSSNLIKLNFEDNNIVIASNSKLGKLREEVYGEMTGEPLEIAFNAKYIMDILKAVDDEKIVMEMTSNISPCVIRPNENLSSLYLVLPVRIARS